MISNHNLRVFPHCCLTLLLGLKPLIFSLLFLTTLIHVGDLRAQTDVSTSLPEQVFPCDTFYLDITVTNNEVDILNDLKLELRGATITPPLPSGVEVAHSDNQDYILQLPPVSSCDSLVISIPLLADCSNNSGDLTLYTQFSTSGVFLFAEEYQVEILPIRLEVFLPPEFDINDSVSWFTHPLILKNTGFGSIKEIWIRPNTSGNIYTFDSVLNMDYTYDGDLIKLNASSFGSIGNGDLLFDKGESLRLTLKWLIAQCGEDVVSFDILVPCNGDICFESQITSTSQKLQLYQAEPRQSFIEKGVGMRGNDTTTLEIKNSAVIHSKENAIYDIRFIIENYNAIPLNKGGIDIDSVIIGNYVFPVYQINTDSTNPIYALDIYNTIDFDPDGPNNGLEDLDGDGFYDDLPPGGAFELGYINRLNVKPEYNRYCGSTLVTQFKLFEPIMYYNNFCTKGTFPQSESIQYISGKSEWGRAFEFSNNLNFSNKINFDKETQKLSFRIQKASFWNLTDFLTNCDNAQINLLIKQLPLQYLAIDSLYISTPDTTFSIPVRSDSTQLTLNIQNPHTFDATISFYGKQNCDSIFFDLPDTSLSVCQNCNLIKQLESFIVEGRMLCDPDLDYLIKCVEYPLPLDCDSVGSEPIELFEFAPTKLYRLNVGWTDSTMSERVNPYEDDISHSTAFVYDTLHIISKLNYLCNAPTQSFEIVVVDGDGDGFNYFDHTVSYFSKKDDKWYENSNVAFDKINKGTYINYKLHSNKLVNPPTGNIQLNKGDSLKIEYKLRVENLNANVSDSKFSKQISVPSVLVNTDSCTIEKNASKETIRIIDYEVQNPFHSFHHMDFLNSRHTTRTSGTPLLPCEPIFCGAIQGFPSYYPYPFGPSLLVSPVNLKNEWRPNIQTEELQFTFKNIADYIPGSFGVYKLVGYDQELSDSLVLIKNLEESDLTISDNNGRTSINIDKFTTDHDSMFRQSLYFIGFYIKNSCFAGVEDLEMQGKLTRAFADKDKGTTRIDTLHADFDYHIQGIDATKKPDNRIIYVYNRTAKNLRYEFSTESIDWASPLTNFNFPYQIEISDADMQYIQGVIPRTNIRFHPTDSLFFYKDSSQSPETWAFGKTTRWPYFSIDQAVIHLKPKSCEKDTIVIRYITRCYEEGNEPDYCEDFIKSDTFIIIPQLPVISASIGSSPTNQVALCDTFKRTFSFQNTAYGTLYENTLLLSIPEFVNLHALHYKWGGLQGDIPLDKSFRTGDTLHIPLDSTLVDTLPGIQFGNLNTLTLEGEFLLECAKQPSFSIHARLQGEAACGDFITSDRASINPIFVIDHTQTPTFDLELSSQFQSPCSDTSELIFSMNSSEKRSGDEFVEILFPLGFEYVANSTTNLRNFIVQEPNSFINREGYNIRWRLNAQNSMDSNITFKFKVVNFCSSGCNSPPVSITIGDSILSPCKQSCESVVSLGQKVIDPFYFRPALDSVDIVTSSSIVSEDSISVNVNLDLDWLSAKFDSTLFNFTIVKDINGNLTYDGADRIIKNVSLTWLLNENLDSFQFLTTRENSCGFILLLERSKNPCICTQHEIYFNIHPKQKVTVCPDEHYFLDVFDDCYYNIIQAGKHLVEKDDTLYYVGSHTELIDTVVASMHCSNGCERIDSFIFYSSASQFDLEVLQGIQCYGDSTGQLKISIQGELTDSLEINWSHDPTLHEFELDQLPEGQYLTTIYWRDCQWKDSIILESPDSLTGTVQYRKINCDSIANYSTWVTPDGGTPPYEVSVNGRIIPDTTNLNAGNHEYTITDSAGCTYENQFTITDTVSTYQLQSTPATCKGINDGIISIMGSSFQEVILNDSFHTTSSGIANLGPGIYDLKIIDDSGCPHSYSVAIQTSREINLDLGDTILAVYNEEVLLMPEIDPDSNYTYMWRPPDLFDCVDCPENYLIAGVNPMTIYLTIQDSAGCIARDTLEILINDETTIFIPNTFSPNGDGINDNFQIIGNGFLFKRLFIYDRWGNQIFESRSKSHTWDGTFKGNPVQIGVYVYFFEYLNAEGKINHLTGSVTIVR